MTTSNALAGIRTVARQELRRRVRAGRWRWLVLAWFLVLLGFTTLLREAVLHSGGAARDQVGTVMYGGLQLLLLALALLVVPALTAQSVNGDREKGVLATLQVTRLTAFEIAAGKLVAAWGTALLFVVVTAPLVGWAMLEGGVPVGRVAVVTLVVALLLGVVCAVALALSALLARSTTSAVLSYLAVFALTAGTLVVFGLATASFQERVTAPEGYEQTRARPDRTWWLLAPNPFVVLADAAPLAKRPEPTCREYTWEGPNGTEQQQVCDTPADVDPLGAIGRAVRDLRTSPGPMISDTPGENPRGGPVWPYGLAANVALGAVALTIATRRLHTPSRSLPRGVRVA